MTAIVATRHENSHTALICFIVSSA